MIRRSLPRPPMRRAIVMLPNGFTLLNLFFGIFAIVSASRGDFIWAGRFVVFGAIADALDGRIARATRTGSRFGEELDSLVDAIAFGLAPALIVYFAVLNREGWDWVFVFIFTACAVMRLARFNVEQAGRKKTHFHGLPSPAAGVTLATYYWFSQTPFYNEAVLLFTDQRVLADLPWHVMLRIVMAGLAFLMISDVPYPAIPTIGFRTLRGILGSLIIIGSIVGLVVLPRQFFFPVLLGYVLYGVGKAAVLGLMDRVPTGESIFMEEEEEEEPSAELVSHDERPAGRRRRRPRRRRTDQPTPPLNAAVEEERARE